MTALTPEQMRALAQRLETRCLPRIVQPDELARVSAVALRTAADQLETVRMSAGINAIAARALGRAEQERSWLDILAIIPADTDTDAHDD